MTTPQTNRIGTKITIATEAQATRWSFQRMRRRTRAARRLGELRVRSLAADADRSIGSIGSEIYSDRWGPAKIILVWADLEPIPVDFEPPDEGERLTGIRKWHALHAPTFAVPWDGDTPEEFTRWDLTRRRWLDVDYLLGIVEALTQIAGKHRPEVAGIAEIGDFLDRYTQRRGNDPELIYGLDGDVWLRVSTLRAVVEALS